MINDRQLNVYYIYSSCGKPPECAFVIVLSDILFRAYEADLLTFNEASLTEKCERLEREKEKEREREREKFDKLERRIDKKKRRRALERLPCDEIKRGLYATITDRR